MMMASSSHGKIYQETLNIAVKWIFSDLGERPLEGSLMVWVDPKWPKLSGFYVVTTLETILG